VKREPTADHPPPLTRAELAELLGDWKGYQLLFLAAYSPDLNPIEHFWATLKTRLRKDLPTTANPFLLIANMCQCYC
jgi:transposase